MAVGSRGGRKRAYTRGSKSVLKRDKKRKALPPGVRRSKSSRRNPAGKIYYERRKNRADRTSKKSRRLRRGVDFARTKRRTTTRRRR